MRSISYFTIIFSSGVNQNVRNYYSTFCVRDFKGLEHYTTVSVNLNMKIYMIDG